MTLPQVLILAVIAPLFMWLVPARWRPWGLLAGSIGAVAWFLAEAGLTPLDFVLILATVGLVVAVWWAIRPPGKTTTDQDRFALLVMSGLLLTTGALILAAGAEDVISLIAASIGLSGVLIISVPRALPADSLNMKRVGWGLIMLIVLLLVVIKVPALAQVFGFALDWDATTLSQAEPFIWLGFSYIAFRLIAVLRDAQAGRLPQDGFSLRDMATYVLFFPAFTAGPIDRAQHFIPEFQQAKHLDADLLVEGYGRIAVGIVKKFVIADTLALVAMSPGLIQQTDAVTGHWIMLYLYAFQIFFDFSGYSDVAIGLGRLLGITLPENFDRPYTQRNIQQFWQRWHITLSTWFRVYFFTPLSRALIRSRYDIPQWGIVLICQLATMILIGLWHGVTVNFFLWGAWHGVGLFVHKMIADNTKGWTRRVEANRWLKPVFHAGSVFVTFHFVALGWVFFALPTPQDSIMMFTRLFGGA
jgi:alginate O-acetyltransferase complex protein AlgI